MSDPNKPVPRGPIPYGFHVSTKNGNALVLEFTEPGPLGLASMKVLYGIADNRRFEGYVFFEEIERKDWQDLGITDEAFFKWG